MAIERGGSFGRAAVDAVAHAEAQGAAPGTGFRGIGPAESSPLGGRRRRLPRWSVLGAAALACAAAAAWHVGQAAWLYGKAVLGQHLLARAWGETRAGGMPVKPWPWADTRPVARLRAPAQRVDLLILEGANGHTLAWGPGHVEGTALPGARGSAVVTGHRDTHFAFLRKLAPGDDVIVEAADGATLRYRVERAFVAHKDALWLPAEAGGATLSLVTCYPFDAVHPGTPLRYAVVARAANEPS